LFGFSRQCGETAGRRDPEGDAGRIVEGAQRTRRPSDWLEKSKKVSGRTLKPFIFSSYGFVVCSLVLPATIFPRTAIPLMTLFGNTSLPDFLYRARVEIIGLAEDFWKDGPGTHNATAKPPRKFFKKTSPKKQTPEEPQERWKADRVRVMEIVWGKGNILPFNKELAEKLIRPLGLRKEMTVLDMTAGIGGLARQLVTVFGVYAMGLEADAEIAQHGKAQAAAMNLARRADVEAYNPQTYVPQSQHERVIMRELLFRIPDITAVLKTVAACLAKDGQLSMMDYCLEAAGREKVAAWLKSEEGVAPLPVAEVEKQLNTAGLTVVANEDVTDIYVREIQKRLSLLAVFLKEHPAEETTKGLVLTEIEKWGQRAAALQNGLKIYHIYALKH
jgi:hypothetical protein